MTPVDLARPEDVVDAVAEHVARLAAQPRPCRRAPVELLAVRCPERDS